VGRGVDGLTLPFWLPTLRLALALVFDPDRFEFAFVLAFLFDRFELALRLSFKLSFLFVGLRRGLFSLAVGDSFEF
jgi:hypothetical protein